ncbi:hypothetical protein ASD00_33865 [Ensifer sp. Root31]|uniref:Zn-dependent hydrolase n=1 Tax=Ensifer sp. Root31 TaxID=1736512 RepID=UPI00070E1F48|nr:Zn-dependent hydrolase [Ensifer sp. Root31]KQU83887.1 hypothetical protein ASD00_33865 [Ensifer sp. Root31]
MAIATVLDAFLASYDRGHDLDGFSGARLAARLAAIAQIGITPDGGSARMGFSPQEAEAKDLVCSWMEEAGLSVRSDTVGNCFGRLPGLDGTLPLVMCGSHIDTVPAGGHFDGVLGVLLALEMVEMWKETGFVPERTYEIAIFTDEEGTRFNVGFVGSATMTGALPADELKGLSDQDGRSFPSVVKQAGLSVENFPEAQRDLSELAAFVEVHIEQGLVLEQQNLPIGIVSGICGLIGLEITLKGMASHAGSTPMNYRRDALVTAGRIVAEISALPSQFSTTAVATVGQLTVFPNGSNVIPGEVHFSVDIRDIETSSLEKLSARIVAMATEFTDRDGIELLCNRVSFAPPGAVNKQLVAKQEEIVRGLGIEPFKLPSGAGHDAMQIAPHVPTAMFFVRSKDGISHNPSEFSSLQDCAVAARALSAFLRTLLSRTNEF